jgi:erythromycin esterase
MLAPVVKPIKLNIISPTPNSQVSYGDRILFNLEVENKPFEIAEVTWTSNLDGKFGISTHFYYTELSLGVHDITTKVSFIDSSKADTTITITVHQRNKNAIVKIVPPKLDSLWFYHTESQRFTCQITDSLGITIPAKSIHWKSNIDGVVSPTNQLAVSQLSINEHDLTLTVTFFDETVSSDSLLHVSIIEDPWAHTDLMNDRELLTPEDPNSPFVYESWKKWIKINHEPLRSLNSEDFSDLLFLGQTLKDKNIIQLGEMAHGIAEQNRIRVRLIKYLHQKLGFSVVAFESGFYECYFTNKKIDAMSANEALKNSLYGFWHTPDLLELFEYIKSSYNTANPLYLAGFDTQPSGNLVSSRPHYFREIIMKIDTVFAESIFITDYHLLSLPFEERLIYIENNYTSLCQQYDQLVTQISDNQDLLKQYYDEDFILTAREMTVSARKYISFRGGDSNIHHDLRVYTRDKQMAETMKYLKDQVFRNRKIVVWAHNCHIWKDTKSIDLVQYGDMMGFWLNQQYASELYTIVSLAYRGRINYGPVQEIQITKSNSVEAILYNARKKHFFLDLSQQVQTEGNRWMFQSTYQSYIHSRVGQFDIRYIPKNQFDALIFIDTVSQPHFLQ